MKTIKKTIVKTVITVAVLAGIVFFGGIFADIAMADYEATRLETLKTNYATMPTEADGSPVVFPTEGIE